jgi:hypothetical protein
VLGDDPVVRLEPEHDGVFDDRDQDDRREEWRFDETPERVVPVATWHAGRSIR